MGNFSCRIGDTVLLKSDTANEAWVAIICEFIEDDDGEKAANFMWFSTEKEVRNKAKKRQDFMAVRPANSRLSQDGYSCERITLMLVVERAVHITILGH